MTIHDTFAGAQYVTKIVDLAFDSGINLQVGSDFHEYSQLITEHRPEQPLGAPFDPTLQGINAETGFWITGWGRDGQLVHTQAMRRFDIGGVSLSDYLGQKFRDFPPAGLALDLDASEYRPGPGAKRISGVTCYHGEAWLKGGDTGFRGTGLAGALARFALATAVLRWSPDYIFGFMPERHAFRGLVEREGYMHSDPGALDWHLADSEKVLRGYMVWMGRDDLSHIMTLPAVDLAA
ncbi:hypothetical protein [Aliiroseovarius subalbicans]|uniref:hypothetical protein n=1 Tax=Aliiroseovarius subalbicans TaxID=2925840 RepID=UPI001F572C0F|nr:hypothetical protein [Aliiroseovarius subalbicans]MCI2398923.1 hypothetical protein [Aliiroseovarius subalbicans]